MIARHLRALRNRLTVWYLRVFRRHVRTVGAWLQRTYQTLFFVFGWLAITWSMFLWRPRAWAASIGILLLLSGLMPVIEAYVSARARSRSLRNE
jgi:hypothetical protein